MSVSNKNTSLFYKASVKSFIAQAAEQNVSCWRKEAADHAKA